MFFYSYHSSRPFSVPPRLELFFVSICGEDHSRNCPVYIAQGPAEYAAFSSPKLFAIDIVIVHPPAPAAQESAETIPIPIAHDGCLKCNDCGPSVTYARLPTLPSSIGRNTHTHTTQTLTASCFADVVPEGICPSNRHSLRPSCLVRFLPYSINATVLIIKPANCTALFIDLLPSSPFSQSRPKSCLPPDPGGSRPKVSTVPQLVKPTTSTHIGYLVPLSAPTSQLPYSAPLTPRLPISIHHGHPWPAHLTNPFTFTNKYLTISHPRPLPLRHEYTLPFI